MKLTTLLLLLVLIHIVTKQVAGQERLLRKREEVDTEDPAREVRDHVLLGQKAFELPDLSPLASDKKIRQPDAIFEVQVFDLTSGEPVSLIRKPKLWKVENGNNVDIGGADTLAYKKKGIYILQRRELEEGTYDIELGKLKQDYAIVDGGDFNKQGFLNTKVFHEEGDKETYLFLVSIVYNYVINLVGSSPLIWLDKNNNGQIDGDDTIQDESIKTKIELYTGTSKKGKPAITVTEPLGFYSIEVKKKIDVTKLFKNGGLLVFTPPAGYGFTMPGRSHDLPLGSDTFQLEKGLTIAWDSENDAPSVGLVKLGGETESPVETPSQPMTTSPPPVASPTATSPAGTNPTFAPPTAVNPTFAPPTAVNPAPSP